MEILLVGNYCHDTLIRPDGIHELLGGSTAYIARALEHSSATFGVISKVGKDFKYSSQVIRPSLISPTHPTTHFIDRVFPNESTSKLQTVGEPIYAHDIVSSGIRHVRIGIAAGVAMEILPETLLELRKRVDFLICDIQGLIRHRAADGTVSLVKISQTPFQALLDKIDLLKINSKEALCIDVPRPKGTSWAITQGPDGTLLVNDQGETRIPATPAEEIDATGAGDSFVAGVALGLSQNMSLNEAIQLGNRYGAFAIQTVGIPDFSTFA